MNHSFPGKQIGLGRSAKLRQWLALSLITLLVMPQGLAVAMSEGETGGTGGTTAKAPARTIKGKKGKDESRRDSKSAGKEEGCALCEQLDALEERVKALSQQLEANAARPVEDVDARREISDLKAQLKLAEERALAAEKANEQLRAGVTASAPSAKAVGTPAAVTAAVPSAATTTATSEVAGSGAVATATQTPTAEELAKRTSKLEATVDKLSAIRFSGDFRLRADGIFRSSLATPGLPGLAHVQNVRGRYRLRLNFDTDVNKWFGFHGQLATGPLNNPQTTNQDFTSTNLRHPFNLSEAWVDFHPNKALSLQGGRVVEVFNDNSRFLFDDDMRFNGFNEKYVATLKEPAAGFKSIEFRAGQYIFTNPNIAVVTAAANNLGPTGAQVGSTGRAAYMFHQGVLFNQSLSEKVAQQFGGDIQIFRNPNQIEYASQANGLFLVQGGVGLTFSGPVPGTGNAVIAAGSPILSARRYQVARLTYRMDSAGFKSGEHEYPFSFNVQVARNVGTGQKERDSMLTSVRLGNVKKAWDQSFMYVFAIKGANSMISQLTDDDLGTGTGVNIRVHHIRWDLGLMKGLQFQNLFFIQNELRNSGQYPNFFVPVNAFTPRQYRIQTQLVFTF